ncbi:MAG: hypothetical protein CL676_12450 [Bdellovibrionaceae bacterium]|nr:hypothetical protein [Pseudobdellovibrionaceae bacterium]|tara:strand:- start:3205 stop:3852 length:648 start_codon:yes stop_codon:yes gene_type:complete
MTKIGTLFLAFSYIISLNFSANSLLFFTPTMVALIVHFVLPHLLKTKREILCSKGFQAFLQAAIFEMKCGVGFLSAAKKQSAHLPKEIRDQILFNISNSTSNSGKNPLLQNKKLRFWCQELEKIGRKNANQLNQLITLEKQIRLDALLRHRSSKALLQTRMQAFFISFLFVGLSVFSLKTYPLQQIKWLILISILLMALGLLLLTWISRKRKWKT